MERLETHIRRTLSNIRKSIYAHCLLHIFSTAYLTYSSTISNMPDSVISQGSLVLV